MTGRYFRTTYTRLERTYLLYYEAPAAFRALCRTTAQIIIYFILSSLMAWLVGISHPPCHSENRALASLCALLWTTAVAGTGHAFSTAVSWIKLSFVILNHYYTHNFDSKYNQDVHLGRTDPSSGESSPLKIKKYFELLNC